MHPTWPPSLVAAVRKIKNVFASFSHHHVLGIPLDWPLRFVLLGGLYLILHSRLGRWRTALFCVAVLLAKELFDIIAVRDLFHPKPPDRGDLADILSGLAGIASGALIVCIRRRASAAKSE